VDVVAIARAIIGALVGGFLVIYAVVAEDVTSRPVIAGVGLFLMGAVTVDAAVGWRRKPDGP